MKHSFHPGKIFAILITLALLAMLSACGQGGGNTGTTTDQTTTSTDQGATGQTTAPSTADQSSTDQTTTNQSTTDQSSATEAYKAVLQGNASYYSTGLQKNLTIDQIKQEVTPDSSISVSIDQIAVVDLDNDGTPEVILSLNINNDNLWGSEVLRYQDGDVYGYALVIRAFNDIKADGTFSFSSGAMDNGFGSIAFSKTDYSISEISYSQSGPDPTGVMSAVVSYFVNQKSATQDEFNSAIAEQGIKPDAAWAPFTPDNIAALLS